MKRTALFFTLFSIGLMLVGFGPRPYSDLAEYRHMPIETRIERLRKAGEDLFLRRRYEDAITVFQTVLALDEGDMKAKLWITKAQTQISVEKNEANKKALYQKYGHLIPKDKIYENWHWGPSVGHFEVRYSEPKPYVPAVRKVRPKAADVDIETARKKAEASGDAADLHELSMLHWSRRDDTEALKAFFDAFAANSEILAKDDEFMLSTISDEIAAKIADGKASAEDYMTSGRLGLIQGDRPRAINHLVKAASLDKALKERAQKILKDFVSTSQVEMVSAPPDILSFRQAYVFDKNFDKLYLRIVMTPKNKGQIVPIDLSLTASSAREIELASADVAFAYIQPGIDDYARLWLVLPEKEGEFPEYEIRLTLNVDRAVVQSFELSNFALITEQYDNWSFVISSEFNFSENMAKGEFEKNFEGVRIAGYNLAVSEGKGPFVPLENFKEPLPRKIDIWKLIENGSEASL
ncbi:MAG: hypothetical protein EOM80_01655 [Erysipelotrichia bacterium]|nr:hypothetical protein [Erysipelotrichia bacterium]